METAVARTLRSPMLSAIGVFDLGFAMLCWLLALSAVKPRIYIDGVDVNMIDSHEHHENTLVKVMLPDQAPCLTPHYHTAHLPNLS